jgi:hypothetical protein
LSDHLPPESVITIDRNTHDRTGAMQKVERLGQATLGTRRGDTRLTGLLKDSPVQVIGVAEVK